MTLPINRHRAPGMSPVNLVDWVVAHVFEGSGWTSFEMLYLPLHFIAWASIPEAAACLSLTQPTRGLFGRTIQPQRVPRSLLSKPLRVREGKQWGRRTWQHADREVPDCNFVRP